MNHKPEDVKAAEEYAVFHIQPEITNDAFLAGCEHKQKEIDSIISGAEMAIKLLPDGHITKGILISLIQKHKP